MKYLHTTRTNYTVHKSQNIYLGYMIFWGTNAWFIIVEKGVGFGGRWERPDENKLLRLYISKAMAHLKITTLYWERRKAGGYKPLIFPLPFQILPFLSSGSRKPQPFVLPCHNIWVFRHLFRFRMVKLVPWNCVFQKSRHVMQKIYVKLFIFDLWIEILMIPCNVNCKTFFLPKINKNLSSKMVYLWKPYKQKNDAL